MTGAASGLAHDLQSARRIARRHGPRLRFRRALIGSGLPNRPETLIPYLMDAPSVDPGSPMPPMPISEEEARDAAAWLYEH